MESFHKRAKSIIATKPEYAGMKATSEKYSDAKQEIHKIAQVYINTIECKPPKVILSSTNEDGINTEKAGTYPIATLDEILNVIRFEEGKITDPHNYFVANIKTPQLIELEFICPWGTYEQKRSLKKIVFSRLYVCLCLIGFINQMKNLGGNTSKIKVYGATNDQMWNTIVESTGFDSDEFNRTKDQGFKFNLDNLIRHKVDLEYEYKNLLRLCFLVSGQDLNTFKQNMSLLTGLDVQTLSQSQSETD